MYGKDIHVKFYFPMLTKITDAFPPSLLGTGILVLIALYYEDQDTMRKLTPTDNPVLNALIFKKWILMNNRFDYELTEKGKIMAELFLTKPPKKAAVPKAESPEVAAVDGWIGEWLKIWPSNVRSAGKLIRSDEKACAKKMKWFVQEYKFTKEQIFIATRDGYLTTKYREGWKYTMLASNFIYKTDESKVKNSELASWCKKLTSNEQSQFEKNVGTIKVL